MNMPRRAGSCGGLQGVDHTFEQGTAELLIPSLQSGMRRVQACKPVVLLRGAMQSSKDGMAIMMHMPIGFDREGLNLRPMRCGWVLRAELVTLGILCHCTSDEVRIKRRVHTGMWMPDRDIKVHQQQERATSDNKVKDSFLLERAVLHELAQRRDNLFTCD